MVFMKTYKSACSLDCWDVCSIDVTLRKDGSLKISGDPEDPITKGFLCQKGYLSANFFQDPERITSPMKNSATGWHPISWQQAFSEISSQLQAIIAKNGTHSIIHYKDAGHGGIAKNIDTAFFNALGGVVTSTGNLCWGAGLKAQQLDFGQAYSHDPLDMFNSQCIVLWGKNPMNTSPHMVPMLKQASKKDIPIILIDPTHSSSVSLATHHYPLLPGSDGHLALAMIKILFSNGFIDMDFAKTHCLHADKFFSSIHHFETEELISATGLTVNQVTELSMLYGQAKPASIHLGYGSQRNRYGCRNLRLINALGALTGNIGVEGGGINYANHYINQWVDKEYMLNLSSKNSHSPTFPQPAFADYVLEERPGEIQGIFTTLSNPLVQLPDTGKTTKAFESIPFKVVIDLRMTDTARKADYVLPCTHIMEESDFIMSSMWHNYFTYTEQVVEAHPNTRHEFDIFYALAQSINLSNFTDKYPDIETYIAKSILPLCRQRDCTPKDLIGKRHFFPGNEIPWKNRKFETKDQLFHLYIPDINRNLPTVKESNPLYPFQLISIHAKHSMHSQHFSRKDDSEIPTVLTSPDTVENCAFSKGDSVRLVSPTGELICRLDFDQNLPINLLVLTQGWWHKNGTVNLLTSQQLSDDGEQATYNDCFCRLEEQIG